MVATPTTLDGQRDPELRSGARSPTVPCGSIGDLIRLHAERRPDACAILASGLAPFSFGDMDSYLAQTGDMLAAVGIGAGSRVGVAFPRTAEATLVNIALACHATVVPFNPAGTHEENAAEARDTRLDALFVPAWTDLPAWLGNARREFGVFRVAKANRSLAECLVEEVSPVPV